MSPERTPRPPRQKMPEQPAAERAHNFDEVPYGLTPEQARLEASRCLQCKKPACVEGCPVAIDIPGFIGHIADGDFDAAIATLKEQTTLPAVCGRVCPQEDQCEKLCVLGKKGDPVAVGYLERFAADYEMQQDETVIPEMADPTGKRVAVVGSGPAGLTCAYELAKVGHAVTVFEAFHKTGGVLVYGIPEFRLPKAIVERDIETLRKMGVEIRVNHVIGKLETLDELLDEEGFAAAFVATGAGLPRFLDIPGEELNGVYSANEFLTRTNLMKAYRSDYDTPIRVGKRTVVFGGGNVAMDSARTALRLGADEVWVLYRRTGKEMPARIEEVHHAEDEGIRFEFLTAPTAILGEAGWVSGVRCLRMELGEPDSSGRRRPIPIDGSEYDFPCDQAIVAIGNGPNPLVPDTTPDLATTRWGNIVADEATGRTSKRGVFAGGDIVTGAATVIRAMGAGKVAAAAMHEFVMRNP